jgi:hypothetical protein
MKVASGSSHGVNPDIRISPGVLTPFAAMLIASTQRESSQQQGTGLSQALGSLNG